MMRSSSRIPCLGATLILLFVAGPVSGRVDFFREPTIVSGYLPNASYHPEPCPESLFCVETPCCDVDPGSIDLDLDRKWQAGSRRVLGGLGLIKEFDFDWSVLPNHLCDSCETTGDLRVEDIRVDLDVGGRNGHGECPSIFRGYWRNGGGPRYGAVSDGSLEAFDGEGHSQIIFEFERPVTGLGMWVFDDSDIDPNGTRLTVVEIDGSEHSFTSELLDSGNCVGHIIEGFIGAVSDVGITRAWIENFTLPVSSTCPFGSAEAPTDCCLEIDHLQIAYLPASIQQLQQVMADVTALNFVERGVENNLLNNLNSVQNSLAQGSYTAAINQLETFIRQIRKTGIPMAAATSLITAAKAIIDQADCLGLGNDPARCIDRAECLKLGNDPLCCDDPGFWECMCDAELCDC